MKYSKYSFLCSDKNTKTVVRIPPLFGKKVGVSQNGVSLNEDIDVLTLQNLMKVNDEPMAL
jgi:hypothetical protein